MVLGHGWEEVMRFGQTTNHAAQQQLEKVGVIILFLFLLLSTLVNGMEPSVAQTTGDSFSQPTSGGTHSDQGYVYLGAESCSGSPCHGNTTKREKLSIDQTEFQTWYDQDRHRDAYIALTDPKRDGILIAQNLGIDKPEESPRCLVCHAVDVPKERQGTYYDIKEGITCEACHGASEAWLGPHFQRDWQEKKHADPLGMYNTENLHSRAEKCLICHLGVGNDIVDHELIGAGHPRLPFELDIYSTRMPSHWRAPKEPQQRFALGVGGWAVGQAVFLNQQIDLLLSNPPSHFGVWPDFIHYDCNSCHHSVASRLDKPLRRKKGPDGKFYNDERLLTDEDKQRQRWRFKDYKGKPGRLVWNSANYTVFRHVVYQADPEKGKRLNVLLTRFQESLTGKKKTTVDNFQKNLHELGTVTGELVNVFSKYEPTPNQVISLLQTISGDGRAIANAGYQSAEQAVFALGSLFENYDEISQSISDEQSIRDLIQNHYKNLETMRSFDQIQFEKDMNTLHGYFSKMTSLSLAQVSE